MICFSLTAAIRGVLLNGANVLASRTIHAKMTFNLLHCQVGNFFERIPMGRIINRFSEDIENLDTKIAMGFSGLYIMFGFNISDIVSIVFVSKSFLLLFPSSIFLIFSFIYRNRYMAAKREVVRL